MPRETERQKTTDELMELYLFNLLLGLGTESSDSSDSESDTNSDTSSSTSSSGDSEFAHLVGEGVIGMLKELWKERYQEEMREIPKTDINLQLLLTVYKTTWADIFQSYLRVTPSCFDALHETIKEHPVFHNNSNHPQRPVDEQLAIALYRFGHYGNAAAIVKVALWAGIGYGTVRDVTIRVMTALCDERFRRAAMPWPDAAQIEQAKLWVEGHSCSAWRDGWCMVDGTLVPLFQRPHHFGNTFFDRKSNYSMNVQIINMPDLRIIDYGIGYPGSQHDATAWKSCRIPNEHNQLLGSNEFVWADSAYPLKSWCQAPYKEPESLLDNNKTHNFHVSAIRIRSEHCMGYLKGRFSSLRDLRLRIDKQKDLTFACLWIASCIHLHNFALHHSNNTNPETDQFFIEGQQLMLQECREQAEWAQTQMDIGEDDTLDIEERVELIEGRLKREELKERLLEYLAERNVQ
ncbi:hypothetical protein EST38_g10265 [Candolleomyces aberdarensis]|uniref:DDE Tnp4 domain-containing protein n=1 Tax=Candolleomyces aberdarensis TaxID=2316362 RepID=A0A4V1Q2M3_9AGAR|nr:hypothetical protein EST38_g10265 [Candolleomyces aberdarensis]